MNTDSTAAFIKQCEALLPNVDGVWPTGNSANTLVVGRNTFRQLIQLVKQGIALADTKATAEEDVERMEALSELYARNCYIRKLGMQWELISPIGTRMTTSSTLRGLLNNYIVSLRHGQEEI